MDKTYRTELLRIFLIEALPEPLTRASAHIQLFDNYIDGTRLRIRSVRDPESRAWTHILQQRFAADEADPSQLKIAEIYLNEAEHARFETFAGTEIRKNRYFHEFDGRMFGFDVYLGDLWGLNIARAEFDDAETMRQMSVPAFSAFEVSGDAFFLGDNLVHKKFADVQDHVASWVSSGPVL